MRVYLMEVEECGQNCPASANLCQRAVCCATAASSNLAEARWKKPLAAHLRLQLEMQRVETGKKTGRRCSSTTPQPGNDVVRALCQCEALTISFLPPTPSRSSSPTEEKPTWYCTGRRRSATTAAPSCTAATSRAALTPWPTSTAAATRAGPLATGRARYTRVAPPAWKSSFPSSATRTATPNSGETGVRRLAMLSYFPWRRWLMYRTSEPVDLRTRWTSRKRIFVRLTFIRTQKMGTNGTCFPNATYQWLHISTVNICKILFRHEKKKNSWLKYFWM